jgi:hypothetical protein
VNNEKIFTALESLLKKECSLYRDYLEIMVAERKFVTKFNSVKISELTEKRAHIAVQMEEAAEARRELCKNFEGGANTKLSEIIARYGSKEHAKRLAPLVGTLKELIKASQQKGEEYRQILTFSQRLIGGPLSLIWSATQHISKVYGRSGEVIESVQRPSNKSLSTLKEA